MRAQNWAQPHVTHGSTVSGSLMLREVPAFTLCAEPGLEVLGQRRPPENKAGMTLSMGGGRGEQLRAGLGWRPQGAKAEQVE